ncbi:hypothetical protein NDA13_006375 [Ustilago tritici]|nr:hypothetical protein NDA13_006375 [Ustilago tritici]
MKLSGMFRIGFVAAIVTALILLTSCIAFGNDDDASTSNPQPIPRTRPRKSPWPPSTVYKYKDYIDVENIKRWRAMPLDEQDLTYAYVPFYYSDYPLGITAPLYSIETPPETIEKALGYHRSVGIIDATKSHSRLIQYDKELADGLFPIGALEIQLFKLDPNLHYLRNLVRHPRNNQPALEDIEHLPHANGKPILSQDTETLGHMLHAARTDPRSFYYFQQRMEPILVFPHRNELIDNFNGAEMGQLRRIMDGYQAAKEKYGQTVASIIWGKPTSVSADPRRLRTLHLQLKNYPRFKHDAPKEDMVRSLQRNGRFRVYKEIGGKKYGYKVLLKNPGSTGESMRVSVEPLTFIERFQEAIHWPRIRLP